MAGLDIRSLPQAVAAFHRHHAASAGKRLEDHVRDRLIAEARLGRNLFFDQIRAFHAAMGARYGATGSIAGVVADIREVRTDRERRRSLTRMA